MSKLLKVINVDWSVPYADLGCHCVLQIYTRANNKKVIVFFVVHDNVYITWYNCIKQKLSIIDTMSSCYQFHLPFDHTLSTKEGGDVIVLHVCISRRHGPFRRWSDWILKSTTTSTLLYALLLSDLQGYMDLSFSLSLSLSLSLLLLASSTLDLGFLCSHSKKLFSMLRNPSLGSCMLISLCPTLSRYVQHHPSYLLQIINTLWI
jgi:hypothetical protein